MLARDEHGYSAACCARTAPWRAEVIEVGVEGLAPLKAGEVLVRIAAWRRRSLFSVCDLPKGLSPGGALARLYSPASCRSTSALTARLARLRLPPTVHDESHYRVWQRRFYPRVGADLSFQVCASCRVWQRPYYLMNIFTENKGLEKLNYIHQNPVKRGLVSSPGDWPWSSWRFYFLQDASIFAMDRLG